MSYALQLPPDFERRTSAPSWMLLGLVAYAAYALSDQCGAGSRATSKNQLRWSRSFRDADLILKETP